MQPVSSKEGIRNKMLTNLAAVGQFTLDSQQD
jgi:hypothetical protein